ncbi:MAG: D-tagatose-bisphosphate aldolase, class II, non-catalytic subunit [Geminicoccaceae bacterium]
MTVLQDIVAANRAGGRRGIGSVCSAHPLVLEAAIDAALADGRPLLIEATCNQVNQEGGYTGMQAADFRALVTGLARERGLPAERLILGGDHLGPNPWRKEPAEAAMAKAEALVRSYAEAGFAKIHLDASMACAGDPDPLPPELIAARAARLARAAEAKGAKPVYVIGTEVPVPGGAHEVIDTLSVTRTADLARTIEVHEAAFAKAGLGEVWARVLAVVVQPGVEFGSEQVVDFAPEGAAGLAAAIGEVPGLAFEAHSTDYQTEAALAALVERHFAILKVGPWLTFAMREALFALAAIESELLPPEDRSQLRERLDAAMLADPSYWQGHYAGSEAELRLARAFSLSDRCRYYWPVPEVAAAVDRLFVNLARTGLPLPLLSQYLPQQYQAVREGALSLDPGAIVRHRVGEVLAIYARACGERAR